MRQSAWFRHLSIRSLVGRTLVAAGLLAATSVPASAAYEIEWTAGHGDIGVEYDDVDGTLELHYHFESGAVLNGVPVDGTINPDGIENEPDEAYVRVGTDTFTTDAGLNSYVLPEDDTSGVPYVGLASEELDGQGFSGVTLSLAAFDGPGRFQLVDFSSSGQTTFIDTDDLGTFNEVTLGVPTHVHYNYAFSELGVYDLTLQADAAFSAGGSVRDTATFRFVVGDLTAVPEPGSMAVLAIGGLALATRRRRRR